MRKYIMIGVGGFLGAILRFVIKNVQFSNYKEVIPLNTLIINISGSFLLALILTTAFEVWEFDVDIRLGIATGFLGAFTTFSTLCKETVSLIKGGYYYSALSYIGFSTMFGLVAACFGVIIAREVMGKLFKKEDSDALSNGENISHLSEEVE